MTFHPSVHLSIVNGLSHYDTMLHAEWIKLSRRPMTWILLVIFLVSLILFLGLAFLVVALNDGIFTQGAVQIQVLRLAQIEEYRRQLRFPGIFGAVLGHVNSIGGICAIILTAGAFGSEYAWGTLRYQLTRQPRRGRYLIIRIMALLLILLLGILIALAVGALSGWLIGLILGNPGQVTIHNLVQLPVSSLRALYVMLPYVMFTLVCCILGRSVLAGAAGGLIFLTLDVSLGALAFLGSLNGILEFIYNLIVQQNINTLVVLNHQSFGLDPSLLTANLDLNRLPSPLQAMLLVGLYSASFFGFAYYRFIRDDIGGGA